MNEDSVTSVNARFDLILPRDFEALRLNDSGTWKLICICSNFERGYWVLRYRAGFKLETII